MITGVFLDVIVISSPPPSPEGGCEAESSDQAIEVIFSNRKAGKFIR